MQLINSRFSELGSLVKRTYHFDLQNLRQKTQTQETDISTLQAKVEGLKAKNLALESDSSSLATKSMGLNKKIQFLESKLLSHQNEINNWRGKP